MRSQEPDRETALSPTDFGALIRRLDRLERLNRRQRRFAVVASSAILVLMLAGAQRQEVLDTVEARRFVLPTIMETAVL